MDQVHNLITMHNMTIFVRTEQRMFEPCQLPFPRVWKELYILMTDCSSWRLCTARDPAFAFYACALLIRPSRNPKTLRFGLFHSGGRLDNYSILASVDGHLIPQPLRFLRLSRKLPVSPGLHRPYLPNRQASSYITYPIREGCQFSDNRQRLPGDSRCENRWVPLKHMGPLGRMQFSTRARFLKVRRRRMKCIYSLNAAVVFWLPHSTAL